MASSYEEPIDNFLEKVIEKGILPKPTPVQRPYTVPNFVKVGRKSRAKPKPQAPPTTVDPDAPQEEQAESQVPTADGEVKRAVPRKRKPPNEKAPATEGLEPSPKPKKRKVAVPAAPIPLLDEETLRLLSEERERHLLSMIQANGGVIEVDLRLDSLFKSYIHQNFPDSNLEIDYKTLLTTLEALEAKAELERIMLKGSTFTGRKLYKLVMMLPGVNLETSERIGELREELRQEALEYKATPMELVPVGGDIWDVGKMPSTIGEVGEVEVEVMKSSPRQRDLAPIPLAIPPSEGTTKKKRKARAKKEAPTNVPQLDKDGSLEPGDEGTSSYLVTLLMRYRVRSIET